MIKMKDVGTSMYYNWAVNRKFIKKEQLRLRFLFVGNL